jgi:plastocyanin
MFLVRARVLMAATALVVLVGTAPRNSSTAQATDSTKVLVKDFMFSPTTSTVKTGSTVTWTNLDDEPHAVLSDTGLFRSGAMDTNESFSFKFDKPGTYHFTCSIHPRMVGTIIVQ